MPVQRPAGFTANQSALSTVLYTAPILAVVAQMRWGLDGFVTRPWAFAGSAGLMAASAAAVNFRRGLPAWCPCNSLKPVVKAANSDHTSHHWFDPYSLSHMLHGVLTYGAMVLMPGRMGLAGRALATCAAAVGWELVENSDYMINRDPKTGVPPQYKGDSVANSMADIAACMAGFFIASRLSVPASVALVLGVEVGMAAAVRDNLTLCTLMLLYPTRVIQDWQGKQAVGLPPVRSDNRDARAER